MEEASPLLSKPQDGIHVFISYAHPDADIARTLYDILKECSQARVTGFLDQYTITSGDNWRDLIYQNLHIADWLIFLYRPGHAYDYCGIEIGIFDVENRERRLENKRSGRYFSIYDIKD